MPSKNTIIVTDSSCDLNDEILKAKDIRFVPLRLITSTKEYRDRVEISDDEVYSILDREIPTTSLPLPEDVEALYDEIVAEGYKNILHISISSGLSGTYNMVRVVAEEYADKINIKVVDSKTLSGGLGLLVLRASELLDEGLDMEQIAEKLEVLRTRETGMFLVQTLEYLRKGGRIGLVEGVVGSLLNIKPIIFVNPDGVYETMAKARGANKAKTLMLEKAAELYKNLLVDVHIVHARVLEEAKELSEKLKSILSIHELYIEPVSPVLGMHTGKGLLGIIVLPRR